MIKYKLKDFLENLAEFWELQPKWHSATVPDKFFYPIRTTPSFQLKHSLAKLRIKKQTRRHILIFSVLKNLLIALKLL